MKTHMTLTMALYNQVCYVIMKYINLDLQFVKKG